MSKPSRPFAVGDRVRVLVQCWDPALRGLIGRVADSGSLPMNPGGLWVEFERPAINPGDVDAAEFLPEDLIRI